MFSAIDNKIKSKHLNFDQVLYIEFSFRFKYIVYKGYSHADIILNLLFFLLIAICDYFVCEKDRIALFNLKSDIAILWLTTEKNFRATFK